MKHIFICIVALVILPMLSFSQSFRSNGFTFRGPVNPIDVSLIGAKTLSFEIKTPATFESNLRQFKSAVAISSLEIALFNEIKFFDIKGQKATVNKVLDGDIQVVYELKEFKIIDTKVITRAPGWVIGFESELIIKDKTGNVLFTRNSPLSVKTYLTDPGRPVDDLVNFIITSDFQKHFNDFAILYLRQPVSDFYCAYFVLPKKDKNLTVDKAFIEKFNQSAEVFEAIEKVDIAQYNALFELARPFWESIRNFNEAKDKDLNRDIQYAANINLAVSYILVDETEKAKPYIEAIIPVKTSFLNSNQAGRLNQWIADINEAKRVLAKQKNNVVAIKSPEDNQFLSSSINSLEKLTFDGTIKTKKDGEAAGKVSILNDNPPLLDLRKTETGSALGSLASLLKTERNTVFVEVPNQKKPVRMKMDDIVSITMSNGNTFDVSRIGETINNTDRYSVLREMKNTPKLSLYVEEYPNAGTYLLKKPGEEDFFEIPSVLNRKKALLKYFEACPAIHDNIKSGNYLMNDNGTYLKLFTDYTTLCK